MQRLGRRVADLVAEHLATLRTQPVLEEGLPPGVRRRLSAPPAEEAEDVDTLRKLMPRIEGPLLGNAWAGHATYAHCRALAGYMAL